MNSCLFFKILLKLLLKILMLKKYLVNFVRNNLFKMKKTGYLFILLLLLLMSWAFYSYLYKDHRDIASEKGAFRVTANAIYEEFSKDETAANRKYLDKTIEVFGKVTATDTEENTIIIDEKMFVYFKDKLSEEIKVQSNVKVKGRFMGYDNLLGEMKMDQSVLEKE